MPGKSSSKNSAESAKLIHFGEGSGWGFSTRPGLIWATDFLIAVLIIVFPFIMGGREAWGHRTLITVALLLGCVWSLHKVRTGGRFVLLTLEPLLIAGLLLVWLQTTPLKPAVLGQLSGEYQRLLEHWPETQLPSGASAKSEEAALPVWNTASLYPTETQHGFLMLLAYGIIGVVVTQRIVTESDCFQLLKLIAISGVLMAAFAIVQLVTSNDKFFWFYRQPFTGTREILKGAFTNRNHFAQFLSLSIGPLLWWALSGRAPKKSTILDRKGLGPAQGNHSRFDNLIDPIVLLLFCAVGGVLLSVMLSLSRGGMVSAGVACAVCLGGLWRSGLVKGSLAIAILALGVMATGGLILFGQEKVEDRVSQLASVDADKIDQMSARRTLWKADLKAIQAFPIVGTGIGSHRFIYPIYMEELAEFSGVSFSHAESSYIHLALEGGLAGIGLLLLGLLTIVLRLSWHVLRRSEPHRVAAIAAVLSGLAGGMIHAAADFIWYVPAVVVTTIILCVIGLRLCIGFRETLGVFMPRIAWMGAGAMCLMMLVKVQPELARRVTGEKYWYQYLIATFDEARKDDSRPQDSLEDLNSKPGEEDLDAAESAESSTSQVAQYEEKSADDKHAERTKAIRSRINLLMASLKADPNQARTSLSLADESLELFELMQEKNENPFSLKDIRDTVRDSQFKTKEDMLAFLKRSVGGPLKLLMLSDQMTRKALALCPVQDEGYEILVSTAFIRDPSDPSHDNMIVQAMRLGQNSPSTRYALGQALFRDGRQKEGLEQWKVAFHLKREARLAICGILGRQFSVEAIFDEFKPTLSELDEVLLVYQSFRRKEDIEKLLWVIAEQTRNAGTPVAENAAEELTTSETSESDGGAGSKKSPSSAKRKKAPATVVATSSATTGREKHLTLLMQAYRVGYEYEMFEQCEELLSLAIECDPLSESPRRAMGLLLKDQMQDYDAAEEYFAWCQEQLPGDQKLEELRRECRRLAGNQEAQERRVNPASFRRR